MISTRGRLRRRLFGIRPNEVTFERRRFPPTPASKRERLERIGREFLGGYHIAMEEDAVPAIAGRLDEVAPVVRGFAYEGAAMALALRSAMPGPSSALQSFLAGPAQSHLYTAHVGVGWARARLPGALRPRLDAFDPLLRYLVVDGQGFHEGYFHPERGIAGQRVPASLRGYERRAFDQGLGRCLWFYGGAEAGRTADAVDAFPSARRDDLWSGVGIACAYAGGASETELATLAARAAGHGIHLAQGVAFGAKAHQRAGFAAESAALASRVICGVPFEEAAVACDRALPTQPESDGIPAYESWRAQVRGTLVTAGAAGARQP